MTFVLFVLLYQRSVDIPIRMFITWYERRAEFEADKFAVEMGFLEETSTALVRNFSKNKDIIFASPLLTFIVSSHPSLLPRLERMKSVIKEMK